MPAAGSPAAAPCAPNSTGNNRRMPTRHIESHDGTRLAVYEEGNPDGPTVVLVHGWPDSHVLWDGVVALLGDK